MIYTLENGKKIRIKDETIKHYQNSMGLSQEEAIQVYLEDEGILVNKEQNALDLKAKENRITATIHQAKSYTKKTQKERTQKVDPKKESLIAELAQMLEQKFDNVQIVNKSKLISFEIDGETFKLDLIRQREKKN